MPGPSFALSALDCELLALTMSTHATPIFALTDSASRPEISALDRAGPLGMQTHRERPPRRISPLECTDTKNASASPLECTDTKSLDLKPFRFHCYKKRGVGGCLSLPASPPAPRMPLAALPGLFPRLPSTEPTQTGAVLLPVRRRTVLPPGGAMPGSLIRNPVPCRSSEWRRILANADSKQQLLRLTWLLCAPRMADSSMNGLGDKRAENHRGPTMRRPCAVLGDTFPVEMRRR